jgi:hypothetical protein
MNSQRNRRLVALAVAVLGSALLAACSVATGQYVPSTVHQPAGRYDLMRYQQSSGVAHRVTTAPGQGGMFDYHYY